MSFIGALFLQSFLVSVLTNITNVHAQIVPKDKVQIERKDKVFNSTDAAAYAVSIQLKANGSHVCIGSIISQNEILTSCSCFCEWIEPERVLYKKPASLFKIVFGPIRYKSKHQVRNVVSYEVHPDCGVFPERFGWDYNYATVKFNTSISIIKNIKPLSFVSKIEAVKSLVSLPSGQCESIGWGIKDDQYLDTKQNKTYRLTRIIMSIWPMEDCLKTICNITSQSCIDPSDDDDHHICAIEMSHENHACEIDPGAPLICAGEIWAIADYRPNCSDLDMPATFSLVQSVNGILVADVKNGSPSVLISSLLVICFIAITI